jgi:hypothetical protein
VWQEHALAQTFFASIKTWLSEIRKEIQDIQRVSVLRLAPAAVSL